MGNILDYLDWRGDLTFEQSPFNEVDNLILACFSYLDLDERAEVKNGNTLSVEELFAAFSRREMKKDLKAESAFLQNTPVLLEKMACAERFRKCTVGGFVNEILSSQAQQFAAVTIGLDDGTTYISFRGTDDTIVGWKEDFNLSLRTERRWDIWKRMELIYSPCCGSAVIPKEEIWLCMQRCSAVTSCRKSFFLSMIMMARVSRKDFSVPEEWKGFCQKSLVSFPRHL